MNQLVQQMTAESKKELIFVDMPWMVITVDIYRETRTWYQQLWSLYSGWGSQSHVQVHQ